MAPKGATLRLGRLGLLSLMLIWLTACSTTEQEQLKTVTGLAMGTSYSVKWLPVDSAAEADEIFSQLMGEDVEARRRFIQDNAADVRFLDV